MRPLQDFLAGTIQAFLAQSGVAAEGIKRLPSLSDDMYVAEQMRLRRQRPLPAQPEALQEFRLGPCPIAGNTSCY